MTIISDLWKARLLLFGASALYGTNFTLVKLLGENIPVGINSALRFGLAALVSLPWLVNGLGLFNNLYSCARSNNSNNKSLDVEEVNTRNYNINNKDDDKKKVAAWSSLWLGLEVGMWNSIGYVLQAVGLETCHASESAFVCSLAVVVVPMLDCMSGKQLESRQWIGAILAVVGVAFLELGDYILTDDVDVVDVSSNGSAEATTTHNINIITWGRILSLTQPFSFGIGFWRMEKAMQRYPQETPRMTAAQLFAIFLASVAYGYSTIDDFHHFPWMEWCGNPDILFGLFWTGVITTALTIYMENLAMKTLSAAETTLIFSTEPLWGAAFAIMFMDEELGWSEAVGAAFILIACIHSNLGSDGIRELAPKMCSSFEMKSSSSTTTLSMTKHHDFDDDDDDTSPMLSDDDSSKEEDSKLAEAPNSTSKRRVQFTDGLVSRVKQGTTSWNARRRPNSPHNNNKGNVLPRWSEQTQQQKDRQK